MRDVILYDIAYKGTGGNISYGHDSSIAGGIAAIRALTDDTNNLSNYESSSADDSYYQGYNTPGHRNSFMQRGGNYLTYGAAFQVLLQYSMNTRRIIPTSREHLPKMIITRRHMHGPRRELFRLRK